MSNAQIQAAAAGRFIRFENSTPYYNLKAISAPSKDNTIRIFFPKRDLPYVQNGTPSDMIKEYIIARTIDLQSITRLVYTCYVSEQDVRNNILFKVKNKKDVYLFGQDIIIRNGIPIVTLLITYNGPSRVRKICLDESIFDSFTPIHKFILQSIVHQAMLNNIDVFVDYLLVRPIQSNAIYSNIDTLDKDIQELLLNHIDEVYENCCT